MDRHSRPVRCRCIIADLGIDYLITILVCYLNLKLELGTEVADEVNGFAADRDKNTAKR